MPGHGRHGAANRRAGGRLALAAGAAAALLSLGCLGAGGRPGRCGGGCAAALALPRADAFPDGGGGNEEGGGGVGPGPSEGGVKKQAGQQHGGQASAQQGLPGVGDRAGRAQFAARAALGNRQDRHDGQGHGSQRYARDGVPSPGIAGQHPDGVGGDVGGEREEGDGNDPQRGPLPGLAYGGVAGGELPGDRGGGGDLDDGVQAEGDQRGGGGDRAGGDGETASMML